MKKSTDGKQLSFRGKGLRTFIKRFIYAQLSIRSGLFIAFGKEDPLIRFRVENDPPSVYWVFRLTVEGVKEIGRMVSEQSQFKLASIRCLDDEKAAHYLVLNAYEVSGLVKGVRGEWSTFVADQNGVARYMILDAVSSTFSMDPIDILTKPRTISHVREGDSIKTRIGEGEEAFQSEIMLTEKQTDVSPSDEWISANDDIYWLNGVKDRTFYDAGLAQSKQSKVPKQNSSIRIGSRWEELAEAEPAHVLVVANPVDFVISPWDNI